MLSLEMSLLGREIGLSTDSDKGTVGLIANLFLSPKLSMTDGSFGVVRARDKLNLKDTKKSRKEF